MYANLVYARGIEDFINAAKSWRGFGTDCRCTHQRKPDFVAAAEKFGIQPIFIAPPTASDETLQAVAQLGKGYTYLLSRAGVTGAETKANMPVHAFFERLQQFEAPPALLGFGISEPAQDKQAIEAGAAGPLRIGGGKIIETHLDNPAKQLTELANFTQAMKQSTKFNLHCLKLAAHPLVCRIIH